MKNKQNSPENGEPYPCTRRCKNTQSGIHDDDYLSVFGAINEKHRTSHFSPQQQQQQQRKQTRSIQQHHYIQKSKDSQHK